MALSGCSSALQSTEFDQTPAVKQTQTTDKNGVTKTVTETGQGIHYKDSKWYQRVCSWFGVSPTEAISHKNDTKIPGLFESKSEGVGLWVSFKTWLKDCIGSLFVIAIVGVGILILPIVFPAAAPVVAALGAVLKKLLSYLPLIGGMIASGVKKAASTIVKGGENFKTLIEKSSDLTDGQKETVISLFHAAQDGIQTPEAKAIVDRIQGK